jgi:hypothetical protein
MINNFHRYLNCPFIIKKPVEFDEIPKTPKHMLLNHLKYEEMESWFKTLGLVCGFKEAFYTPPNSEIPIHTDQDHFTNHVKVNITWGPEEGVVRWWNCKKMSKKDYNGGELFDGYVGETTHQHNNLWAKKEDCELLYEINTNKLSLLNVGIPHSTLNTSDKEGRWTLCFGLWKTFNLNSTKNGEDLKWDESLEFFKDYILE